MTTRFPHQAHRERVRALAKRRGFFLYYLEDGQYKLFDSHLRLVEVAGDDSFFLSEAEAWLRTQPLL